MQLFSSQFVLRELAHNFCSISFVHCLRESNKVAHLSASRVEGPLTIRCYADPPIFILDSIANDVNLFEVQSNASQKKVPSFPEKKKKAAGVGMHA